MAMQERATGQATGGDRRWRRQQRTNAAILDAAEQILLETSARTLRLEDVADRADVAVRTLYNHFGSREGLLLSLAERALDAVEPRLLSAFSAPGEPRLRARRLLLAYAGFFASHPEKANVLVAALGDPTDCPAPAVAERVASRHLRYVDLLQRALGAEDAGSDPRHLALFLLAALHGVLALTRQPAPLRLSPAEAPAVLVSGLDALLGGDPDAREHRGDEPRAPE